MTRLLLFPEKYSFKDFLRGFTSSTNSPITPFHWTPHRLNPPPISFTSAVPPTSGGIMGHLNGREKRKSVVPVWYSIHDVFNKSLDISKLVKWQKLVSLEHKEDDVTLFKIFLSCVRQGLNPITWVSWMSEEGTGTIVMTASCLTCVYLRVSTWDVYEHFMDKTLVMTHSVRP